MSTTYIANIIQLLIFILPALGVNLGQSEISAWVANTAAIIGGIWVFFGRYRAGGLTWWGGRKK